MGILERFCPSPFVSFFFFFSLLSFLAITGNISYSFAGENFSHSFIYSEIDGDPAQPTLEVIWEVASDGIEQRSFLYWFVTSTVCVLVLSILHFSPPPPHQTRWWVFEWRWYDRNEEWSYVTYSSKYPPQYDPTNPLSGATNTAISCDLVQVTIWPSHVGESVGYLTITNFELGYGYDITSPPTKLCPSNTICRIYSDMNTLGRLLKSCDPITITDEVRSLSANLSTGIILIASVLLVLT